MSVILHKFGGSRFTRRRSPPMSEINVTPFVDVMLVLLVVFFTKILKLHYLVVIGKLVTQKQVLMKIIIGLI